MARIFVPAALRSLTGGNSEVVVAGATVREAIDQLDAAYPGTKALLCKDDHLRPGLMVAVDSSVASSGLRHPLTPNSEVHFLPAIGGG